MSKIQYAVCFVIFFALMSSRGYSQGTGNHVTMSLQNCLQTDPSTLQFDLFVVSDGASNSDLRVTTVSYGVNFDTLILKSGATLTPSLIAGSTDPIFYPGFTITFLASTFRNHIRITGNAYTGANDSGLVNTSGTAVTYFSGLNFPTGAFWAGHPIIINGVWYTIASVNSSTSITLTTSAGTQTHVKYGLNSLQVGHQYRVGTIQLQSSSTLVGNHSPNFTLQDVVAGQKTNTAALAFIGNATGQTAFSVTGTGGTLISGSGQRSVSVSCNLTLNPCDLTTTASSTISCNGQATGTATAFPSSVNDFEPWTYLWSGGGQTDNPAVNLAAGTYTVTVTDDANCTAVATVTVTQPATPIELSCGGTNVTCNGGSNGTASVIASGGTPGYSFLWSNGQATSSISGLTAGTYTVTVTDNTPTAAGGCTATCFYVVTQPTALSVTCSSTNKTCTATNNGTATASITGGGSPYSFHWSNGGSTSTITGLGTGTYSVTVTDVCNAVVTCSATVTNPPALSATASGTSLSCAGGNTGSASVTASGGTPPYSYLWSNGQTTTSMSNLSGATYTVTVTDNCSVTATSSYTVSAPPAVAANCGGTGVSCFGGNNGTASVTASGGTPGYTYLWSFNNRTTTSITGLSAGTYTVTVTDNCTTPGTATCSFTVTQPAALSATCGGTNITCNGLSTGSATVTASGGTSPYAYLWSNGRTTSTNTALSVGTYSVTVTDSHSCSATCSRTLTQPAALTVTLGSNSPVCLGNSTNYSSVTINLTSNTSGGSGPYTYAWTGPSSFTSTAQNPVINGPIAATRQGTYTVTVTDANSCTSVTTTFVAVNVCNHVTMTLQNCSQPTSTNNIIQFDLMVVSDGSPGSDLRPNSFQYGITYNSSILQAGDTVAPAYQSNTSDFVGTNFSMNAPSTINAPVPIIRITENALAGGNTGQTMTLNHVYRFGTFRLTSPRAYVGNMSPNFVLQDAAAAGRTQTAGIVWIGGNSSTTAFNVAGTGDSTRSLGVNCNIVLNPCSGITATATSTPVNCFGGNNGTATASANTSNGLTYSWSPGGATTSSITGLTAGNYTVIVNDANGCPGTATVTVTQPTAVVVAASPTAAIACNGGNTTVSVSASGGSPGYTGTGTFTRTAGTYTFSVTDSHGCTGTTTLTITQPTALSASCSGTNLTCNGANSGTASVTASGGTPAYSYLWNNGSNSTTASISGLAAGTYTVTVTDSQGCTNSCSYTVTQPNALSLGACAHTDVSCSGNSNGTASAGAVTNNIGTIHYLWSTGQTITTITGLSAGTYTLTVSDNCSSVTCSQTVNQPSAVTASASSGAIACSGGSTSVTVSGSGGTSPYTGTGSFTRTAGTYSFIVTDSHGCTGSTSITVTQPTAVTATSSSGSIACNGGSTNVTVNATGGTSPYSGTGSFSRTAGTYSFVVTDNNGCTGSTSITVTQPAVVSISASNNSPVCGSTINLSSSVSGVTVCTPIRWTVSAGPSDIVFTPASLTITAGDTVTFALASIHDAVEVSQTDWNNNVNNPLSGGLAVAFGGGTVLPANLPVGTHYYICQAHISFGMKGIITVVPCGTTFSWTGPNSFTASTQNTTVAASASNSGTYTVTVTNSSGCSATATTTVSQPNALSAASSSGSIACSGGNTTITVTASGGTSPYSGTGSFTRTAGTYSFVVTDNHGCTSTTSITITQPTALTASSSSGSIACNGGSATITVTASGGTSPYNGTGTFTRTAGTYTFVVTDNNGCTASASRTLTQPTALTANCSNTNLTCNGNSNASASVAASGGAPGYTYSWSNGATASSTSGLAAGTYCVTVTDTHGCSISCCSTVTQPAALSVSASSNSPVLTGSNLNLSSTGGFTLYSWSGPNGFSSTLQSPSITSVTAANGGTYTVTVTNATGCTGTATTTVVITPLTNSTLTLKVVLSGFYSGGQMVANLYNLGYSTDPTAVDTIIVNLFAPNHLSIDTFPNPDFTSKAIVHVNDTAIFTFPGSVSGNSYYIAVRHRNHLETWSTNPVAFSTTEGYNLTTATSALNNGFNPPMKVISGALYGLWAGDVDQNGTVDAGDMAIIDNQSAAFLFGYYNGDCDGSGDVGASDMSLVDNNTQLQLFNDSPRHSP